MALSVDTTMRAELILGPVLYLWEPGAWRDFYHRIADEADVDTVVIGEVVCSKRMHFHDALLDGVVERLAAAGKSVRVASLALVTLERELKLTHRLVERGLPVEVSELSGHAAMRGRSHAVGPLVNVYNAATANVLAKGGATSICLPPELPLGAIRAIAAGSPGIGIEVFAFGRVPLAISARCAHARIKGQTKDNCRFVCGEDPDGLMVDTLDGQPFLAINGVQTMSGSVQCLLADVPALLASGVSGLRLSPQVCDMAAVASLYRATAEGLMAGEEALAKVRSLYPAMYSNGFLHAVPGHVMTQVSAP
jgi:collagenase-like PrtC family protease